MNIIIFGATGTIGRQIVLQALAQGHGVTAFVRSKEKLDDTRHPHLRFATGNVLDLASVSAAIAGHDAVLCALGAGRKGIVRAEGTRNILQGMQANGVQRLICQTTLGCGESRGNLNFLWKHIMFGWLLKDAYKDHELQEQYIRESNAEWTIVRPAAFTNGMVTGCYRHGFASTDRTLKLKISRADVALFMLQQLNDAAYIRLAPGLSY